MSGARVVLAGGSGFLGALLADDMPGRDFEVVVLTRQAGSQDGRIRRVQWDGRSVGEWAGFLDGAQAVVNLAGRSVNCRFTPGNVRDINESRVNSVRAIGEAIRSVGRPPKVWVQAGGVSVYGERGDIVSDETSPAGEGFLADTCRLWEGAFNESQTPTTRRVLLRIGLVLSSSGGAFPRLAAITKWGLGGRAGSGRQYISWIHARDMTRVSRFAIENDAASGVFNACAPNPVTNGEFMRELRHALCRPWTPPVPEWAVGLGARVMGTEPRLALAGCRCAPKRLLENGFTFDFPNLPAAFGEIFHSTAPMERDAVG